MRFLLLTLIARAASVAVAPAPATPSDLARAHTKVPGAALRGSDYLDMTAKLNAHLAASDALATKACAEFSYAEVTDVLRVVHAVRDAALESVYRAAEDNRRLGTFGKLTDSIAELEALWKEEAAIVGATPALHDMARDAKCHEAVMWYVHHLGEEAREQAAALLTLPLLPTKRHMLNPKHVAKGSAHDRVHASYLQSVSCTSCHATGQTAANNEYVAWPEEVEYQAHAYGPFPFWDNGGPGCTSCSTDIQPGAQLRVRWSSKLGAENLMHANCALPWVSGGPVNKPCNHLFVKGQGAFIYTPKTALAPDADGAFCCRTYAATSGIGAVPQDWMKTMTYSGVVSGFAGASYSGSVKHYSGNAGISFWYLESAAPDATMGWNTSYPVQQGEGCYDPAGKFPTQKCQGGLPALLFHDYDAKTFKAAAWTAGDFAIPDVCKTTTTACTAPAPIGPGPGGDDDEGPTQQARQQYRGVLTLGAAMAGVHTD